LGTLPESSYRAGASKMDKSLSFLKRLPEWAGTLLLSRFGGIFGDSEQVERSFEARDVSVGMKTDKLKFLGLAAGLAIVTAGCASDEPKGAPATVIIERDRGGSAPVIIEKESDSKPVIIERDSGKDVKVDVDVDKD
jgi:hypothetical protein